MPKIRVQVSHGGQTVWHTLIPALGVETSRDVAGQRNTGRRGRHSASSLKTCRDRMPHSG